MSKQKIGAREAVNDIRSGMTDAELMKKYGLTAKGLESLFRKLVEAKLLEESFVSKRTAPVAADRGAESRQPPAPIPESAPPPGLGEPSKLSTAILQDIKDGRHDSDIMRRHELSPGKLNEIRDSLGESGLLDLESMGPPKVDKTKVCPFCFQEIKGSSSKCNHCGEWLEPPSSAGPGATFSPVRSAADVQSDEEPFEEEKECPWEERESYGTINAYFQTASKCILTPTSFFSKLPTRDGYLNPILFVAMTLPVATVLTYLWIGLFTGMRLTGMVGILFLASLLFVAGLIFVPIFLAIWSGILHLCLYLVGGAREGYQATFRVVSYSSVTSVFNAVPFVGNLASLWGLVLTVIGLRETHKTTTGKAVAALAIPVGIFLVIALISAASSVAKLTSSVSDRNIPNQACNALETYIARVDGVVGLDADTVESEVEAAGRDLVKDLEPFRNQLSIALLQQKALLFGNATALQAKAGSPLGKGIDSMREDLRKMCRK
ncbi:MAG: YIP1 family protein [Desulfomonilaceae bacterium]